MALRHVRDHLAPYLALSLVLGMGSAHAATAIANGSVTTKKLAKNAVTTAKIDNSAVTSAEVDDRSLTASDLAVGVLPADGYVWSEYAVPQPPEPAPERVLDTTTVTLPRAGTALVNFWTARIFLDCSSGSATAGLYVDGVPLPGTGQLVPAASGNAPYELGAVVDLTAGPHLLTVGASCPSGDPLISAPGFAARWTLELVTR